MGFGELFAILSGAKEGIKLGMKKKEKKDDFEWETHCENCGELLEDCFCDDKELSFDGIVALDLMDEEDEEEDTLEDNDEDDGLSFDNFQSLDDEDW